MEYTDVKAYLDEIVKTYKEATRFRHLTNSIGISLCVADAIVHDGIDVLADIMGLELKENTLDSDKFKYEYAFMYEGVCFISFRVERLESFAGTDRKQNVD